MLPVVLVVEPRVSWSVPEAPMLMFEAEVPVGMASVPALTVVAPV
jgi:hypothetical protein